MTYTLNMDVMLTKRAEKSLRKVPRQIAANFFTWKREMEEHGIDVVRKIPGYHDEPLAGKSPGSNHGNFAPISDFLLNYRNFSEMHFSRGG